VRNINFNNTSINENLINTNVHEKMSHSSEANSNLRNKRINEIDNNIIKTVHKTYKPLSVFWTYTKLLPKKSVCVKSGEEHKTEDCNKPKKSKAKCANCDEAHTANWKGCSAYKQAEEKAHPKKVSAVQRIQRKPAKTVTTAISYAQMTSSPRMPKTSKQQQNDPTLIDVLSALNNITKSLEIVTSKLDRLESNQSKSNDKKKKKKK